jgi:hypothetical protein
MSSEPLLLKGRHPAFEPPADPQTKIWRYMDFTQFVSMLEEKGLLFTRADLLVDKSKEQCPSRYTTIWNALRSRAARWLAPFDQGLEFCELLAYE